MIEKVKRSSVQVLDFLTKHPRQSVLAIFILSAGVRFSLLALYLLNGNHLYSGEADSIARSLVKDGSVCRPFCHPYRTDRALRARVPGNWRSHLCGFWVWFCR